MMIQTEGKFNIIYFSANYLFTGKIVVQLFICLASKHLLTTISKGSLALCCILEIFLIYSAQL